jgi:hypothetical protein
VVNIDEESGQVDAVEMLPSQSEGSGIFGRIENQDGPLVGDVIPIEEGEPWAQLDDEEGKWYNIFVRYYLPLGISRSVRAAYRAFCEIEKPQILTKEGKLPYTATPHYWLSISRRWDWVERAQAFDRALNRQVLNSVELAHEILVKPASSQSPDNSLPATKLIRP